METIPLKSFLKKRFRSIYKRPARILAVQLDGFSHRLIYDHGKNTSIKCESYSHCMPEGNWSANAALFFASIGNAGYQNNAREIIFILPSER